MSVWGGARRASISCADWTSKYGKGEAVGITGHSGSGKSTLLMVLAGLERVQEGAVAVDGQALEQLSEDALARFRGERIGIVFQSFHLIPTMTALENVAVPLELSGKADAFAIARRELEAVGLGNRLDHYPAQLSGGEQQRVALARALAPNPAILVADEPTGNLDDDTGRSIVDLIFATRAARSATLILVTHDTDLAARCDRTIRLRSGAIESDIRNPSAGPDGSGAMSAKSAKSSRVGPFRTVLRLAVRGLRGGLQGYGIFLACIALGVAAIAGVGSVAGGLADVDSPAKGAPFSAAMCPFR